MEASSHNHKNTIYEEFKEKINSFVGAQLANYTPSEHLNNKVIHDPVWGTTLFYPWELRVLDSPLLQRLRRINQVGLALLTYPSSHHTRFEHTLGVMSVATKMITNINQESQHNNNENKIICNEELYNIRFAALMHDVGHCFFSHLSETIYGNFYEFIELKKSVPIFETAKEHEIFAFLIVTCENFRNFVQTKVNYPFLYDNFFEDIGKMIVGAFIEPPLISGRKTEKKYYLTQIINGQFDADKLDYLRRDSYTAGLALTYDIERFLYKIKIFDQEEKNSNGKSITGRHLTIPITGISAVEEMVFSQLMLASYIYQHHKVLATDALIQDVVEGLAGSGKLRHPCDFLYYCDDDIFNIYDNPIDTDFNLELSKNKINATSNKTLADIVRRVRVRELPKRAFTINYNTTLGDSQESSKNESRYVVADIADDLRKMSSLRDEICHEAQQIVNELRQCDHYDKYKNINIDNYDIHISIPKTSIAKNLSNAFVAANDGHLVKLSEVVRLSDWADAFAYHKWNAYIFSRADICPIVSIASKIVLEKKGIKFDDKKVFISLKIKSEIEAIYQNLVEIGYHNIVPPTTTVGDGV